MPAPVSPVNLPMMEKDASVFMDEMQGERQGALSSLLSSSISSWGYFLLFGPLAKKIESL